jgi:hypothetical protein
MNNRIDGRGRLNEMKIVEIKAARLLQIEALLLDHPEGLNTGAQRMFKPKASISGRLGNSSGEWIRYPFGALTTDLRVTLAPSAVLRKCPE